MDDQARTDQSRPEVLFKFLQEYSKLRYKTSFNTEGYEYQKDFPLQSCSGNPSVEQFARNADNIDGPLLRVKKPRFTPCPKPDASFKEWLQPGWDIYPGKVALEFPNERLSQGALPFEEAFNKNAQRVSDYKRWLDKRSEWADARRAAVVADSLYKTLYDVHTELLRNPETKELVAASMYFESKRDGRVNHPLLIKRIRVVLDAENEVISLIDTDDAPRLYTELLNSIEGLNYSCIRDAENRIAATDCHPFDVDTAQPIFRSLINSLTSQGQYLNNPDEYLAPGTQYFITCKMSFFLREKPNGVARAIERILEALDTSSLELPGHLLELMGSIAEKQLVAEDEEKPIEDCLAEVNGEAPDILLAKSANKEQLRIARRIETSNAVLVQGPPGTGKTHTIANLMGHFLAQGKTVLVSSYTTKALKVLKDKLPEEMQGLCVSSIDGATADMERSVDSIVEHQSTLNLATLNREIEQGRIQREAIIASLAEVRKEIFSDLENEHGNIQVEGESFSPMEAALFIGENAEELSNVIPGIAKRGTPFPLTDEELTELYALSARLDKESDLAFEAYDCLDGQKALMDPKEFKELCLEYRNGLSGARAVCDRNSWSYRETGSGVELKTDFCCASLPKDVSIGTLEAIRDLLVRYGSVASWVLAAAADALRGEEYVGLWKKLCDQISHTDTLSTEYTVKAFGHELRLEEGSSLASVKDALCTRKTNLGKGKFSAWLGGLFASQDDSAADSVLVDGHSAETSEECDLALLFIDLQAARKQCSVCWSQLIEQNAGPIFWSLDANSPEHVASHYIALIEFGLAWYEGVAKEVVPALAPLGIASNVLLDEQELVGENERVRSLSKKIGSSCIDILEFLCCWSKASMTGESISALRSNLQRGCSVGSSTFKEALAAVDSLDQVAYSNAFEKVSAVLAGRKALIRRRELLDKLERVAPSWSMAVRERADGHTGPDVPQRIYEAWKYKQIMSELSVLHKSSTDSLQKKAVKLGQEYRKATSSLATKMAWKHLIEKTSKDVSLYQALTGWKQTMMKIGKGTGKRAAGYRAEARNLMGKCQRAVPCWIMPMNLALSTFDPRETRFDVLIVDEASQCDITSLALTVLADKLIVVGDDKQVSPMAVGVDNEAAQSNIESHIQGVIPNAHLYGPKTSLYDLAATTFQPLMLREHFRCVPGIIGYCNETSYDGKIQPLRDKGSTNLYPPIVVQRVPDGLRSANGKTNQKEAEETVKIIKACLDQPEYAKKSFGVISLLGSEQARVVQNELYKALTISQIEEHSILCGDAANFQGDERDVIILNLVDSNEGEGPLRLRTEGPDDAYKKRYNVAVSRAKDQLWIVHSLDASKDLKAGDLRRGLLDYASRSGDYEQKARQIERDADSPFESEVAKALLGRGYEDILQQFPVGSYRIDIAIVRDGCQRIAIECDGERWHSGEQKLIEDLERQTVLERLGWKFIRIRGSRYYANKAACLEEVFGKLEEMGAYPKARSDKTVSSELLDRVRARMKVDGPNDSSSDGRVVSSAKDDGGLRGTRLYSSTIEDALNDSAFVSRNPVTNNARPFEGLTASAKHASQASHAALPSTERKPFTVPSRETKPVVEKTTSNGGAFRFSRVPPVKLAYKAVSLQSYHATADEYGVGQNRELAVSMMSRIVEEEGPVELGYLISRTRESFGLKRAGANVANKSKQMLVRVPHRKQYFNGGTFIYPKDLESKDIKSFRTGGNRDINEIAPEELVAALRYTLRNHPRGLDEDSLIKATSTAFGFRRTGGTIVKILGAALKLAVDDGAILLSFGYYRLP